MNDRCIDTKTFPRKLTYHKIVKKRKVKPPPAHSHILEYIGTCRENFRRVIDISMKAREATK